MPLSLCFHPQSPPPEPDWAPGPHLVRQLLSEPPHSRQVGRLQLRGDGLKVLRDKVTECVYVCRCAEESVCMKNVHVYVGCVQACVQTCCRHYRLDPN